MNRIVITGLLFIIGLRLSAQGKVEVYTDPDVQKMEENRVAKNKSNDGKVKGYRIMIAFYSNRESANSKLSEVKGTFGAKYSAVILYDEPNFKIYVGEFTIKNDAETALNDVRKKYPGARIVSDTVNPGRVH